MTALSVRLSHYVYSSLEGYRTIYASEDLSPALVSSLEALAKKMYRPAQTRDVFAWLWAEGEMVCAVKGFQCGTDHAGRRRSCVHAVAFSARDAAGRWFVTPFSLPTRGRDSVFIPPDAPLQSVANELVPECELPAESEVRTPPPAGLRSECVAALLSLMIEPGTRSLILDRSPDRNDRALQAVQSLSWIVPPTVRRTLAVSASTVLPDIEGLPPVRMAVMPYHLFKQPASNGPALSSAPLERAVLRSGGVPRPDVVLEVPGGAGRESVRDNVYALFAAASLAKPGGLALVKKLVELLERHPPRVELTPARYVSLLQGFAKVEPWMSRGIIDVRRDALESLSAAEDFAAAGMPSASLDILDSVVSAVQMMDGDLSRAAPPAGGGERDSDVAQFREALARIREGTVSGYDRHAEAIVFLAEKLKDAVGEIG